MRINAKQFQNIEGGSVAILGNGPSLDNWELEKLECDTIGINLSIVRFPVAKYYVTVARDRAKNVEEGKIKAEKAVFTNREVAESCSQPVVQVDMSLPDDYRAAQAEGVPIFDYDLTKPIHCTYGGLFAIQVALFLGYDVVYLIGFDGGGLSHFYPLDKNKPGVLPEHHINTLWHVAYWLENQDRVRIYQTNPEALIKWFPIKEPPIGDHALRPREEHPIKVWSIHGYIVDAGRSST